MKRSRHLLYAVRRIPKREDFDAKEASVVVLVLLVLLGCHVRSLMAFANGNGGGTYFVFGLAKFAKSKFYQARPWGFFSCYHTKHAGESNQDWSGPCRVVSVKTPCCFE